MILQVCVQEKHVDDKLIVWGQNELRRSNTGCAFRLRDLGTETSLLTQVYCPQCATPWLRIRCCVCHIETAAAGHFQEEFNFSLGGGEGRLLQAAAIRAMRGSLCNCQWVWVARLRVKAVSRWTRHALRQLHRQSGSMQRQSTCRASFSIANCNCQLLRVPTPQHFKCAKKLNFSCKCQNATIQLARQLSEQVEVPIANISRETRPWAAA